MNVLLKSVFQGIKDDEDILVARKTTEGTWRQRLVGDLSVVDTFVEEFVDSNDLYFGPAIRVGGQNTIERSTVVWLDLDLKDYNWSEKKLNEALSLFVAPPSFVVSSGHGKHIYWLVHPSVNGQTAQEIMRGICKAVIGADSHHNPKYVLRIPETKNYKDVEKPVPVEVVHSAPNITYDPKDLLRLADVRRKTAQLIASGDTSSFRSRSELDFMVIKELVTLGVDNDTIETIFSNTPVGAKFLEEGEHYLAYTIKKAKVSVGVPDYFQERGGCYYAVNSKGLKKVSTFLIHPEKLIEAKYGDLEDSVLGTISSNGRDWKGIILPKSAFSSTSVMLRYLPSLHWQWTGTDADTKNLLLFLTGKLHQLGMPHAFGTNVVGRHGEYWVTKDHTISESEVYTVNEAPIAYMGRKLRRGQSVLDTTPNVTLEFPNEVEYAELVKTVAKDIRYVNEHRAVLAMVGWFFACAIKPLLWQSRVSFPHLNVYGTKGSGKSTTISKLFMPLLGVQDASSWTPNTTSFVLKSIFSTSNAVPVNFGEFRAATILQSKNDFLRTVLMAYDKGQDARGRADLTTEVFELLAPVVLDGEDALMDTAAQERSIYVHLSPQNIKKGSDSYEAMMRLIGLPLHQFAGRYLQHTLSYDADDILEKFNDNLQMVYDSIEVELVDRVSRNIAVMLIGLELYNEHVAAWGGETLEAEPKDFVEPIINQHMLLSSGSSRSVVDYFVEDAVNYMANSDLTALQFMSSYDIDDNVLWLHLHTAIRWWQREQRVRGKGALEMIAIRAQMNERREYISAEQKILTRHGPLVCFGIRLEDAVKCGLGVPEVLNPHLVVLKGELLND